MAGSEDDGLDLDAARQDGVRERPGLGAHALSVQVHGALRTQGSGRVGSGAAGVGSGTTGVG